jgi:hypothetical protein
VALFRARIVSDGPVAANHPQYAVARGGPVIGVDINVLVRYLVQDDAAQAKLASAAIFKVI